MKMKYKTMFVVLLSIFFIFLLGFFWSIIGQNKLADNVQNNIVDNQLDLNFMKWKQTQIEEYQYATDLDFNSGNVVSIKLEANEKALELISGIPTKMNTYSLSGVAPLIIRVKKGDRLDVTFVNNLNQDTTVHWHGVRVPNSEDGVPGVTQDPVKPGETYNYTFVVNDPGTFLFHPHKNHSEQIGRGLYGVLIVEDPKEPKYDKEFVWVLKDFRVGSDGRLTNDFGNFMDAAHGGRLGNLITINNMPDYKVNVSVGDLVRVRLANMSNARIYNLDLSGLDAKVIATDDSIINNPKKVKYLELGPGERYDLEIKVSENIDGLELFDRYFTNRPNKLVTFETIGQNESNKTIQMITGVLPDWRSAKYNKPDVVIDLGGMGVMGGDEGMMMGGVRGWTINGGIFPKTNKPIILQRNKMYVIRMVNNSFRDHPMHLHGDFFQVISVNGMKGEFIGWKDTVNVKPRSYVDVAIIPTNTGDWAFHCHILEHADLGMFTTVNVVE